MSNELISYIETEIKRGVQNGAVQEALIAAGWKPIEVADAFRIVTERAHAGTTGMPYLDPQSAQIPPTITQPEIQGFIPKSGLNGELKTDTAPAAVVTEPDAAIVEDKPKKHGFLVLTIIFGVLLLGAAGWFFVRPLLDDPGKHVRAISTGIEQVRAIQYSGDYEITAPAGIIFSDKILVSTFRGIAARQANAVVKGTFIGVDDWFDLRSKKNEVKFVNKINIPEDKGFEFTATTRLIGNSLYARLSESNALFDEAVSRQGANWVRFDEGSPVPPYAYGFWGGANLYNNGFPRELAQYLGQAVVGKPVEQPTGEIVMPVKFPEQIVTYFSTVFMTGDNLGQSGSIGPKFTVSSLTEIPTGELTFSPNGAIKKAVIIFGFKTKEYTVPVHIRFTITYDKFDTPPVINIPPLVVPYTDLIEKEKVSDLPEALRGFFSDVRTIASVYKGVNDNSFKGVCSRTGTESDASTELTIPFIATKIAASGYEVPTCSDSTTAWAFYTRDATGYYCVDSRGFSGKAAKQPLGDKCN